MSAHPRLVNLDLRFWMIIATGVATYLLLMQLNPIRRHLRDGARAIQRYPALWSTLALFAWSHAVFRLGWRNWGEGQLPPLGPSLKEWNTVWHGITPIVVEKAAQASWLPSWETVAEIFDSPRATFPLSALAALLFFFNFRNFHGHFRAGLERLTHPRRWLGSLLHAAFLLCVVAAFLKPFVLMVGLPALGHRLDPTFLLRSATLLDWLSALFETFFGIGVQLYLLLMAHAWVHGVGFEPIELRAYTMRRFSAVIRWAALVALANTLLIHLPLLVALLPPGAHATVGSLWNIETATRFIDHAARPAMVALTLLFCTLEISLALHALSLRESLHAHLLFVRLYPWRLGWFIALALLHSYALEVLTRSGAGILAGSGTFLLLWKLTTPLLHALLIAWLLAAWVSLYKGASEQEPEEFEEPEAYDQDHAARF